MTLPASWTLIPVTAKYRNLNGDPVRGAVRFATAQVVVVDGTVIVPKTITGVLDADGRLEVQLPSTDDPALMPAGWAYRVTEDLPGGRAPYWIFVEHDRGPIDLATVAPVVPPPDLASTRGPKGDTGDVTPAAKAAAAAAIAAADQAGERASAAGAHQAAAGTSASAAAESAAAASASEAAAGAAASLAAGAESAARGAAGDASASAAAAAATAEAAAGSATAAQDAAGAAAAARAAAGESATAASASAGAAAGAADAASAFVAAAAGSARDALGAAEAAVSSGTAASGAAAVATAASDRATQLSLGEYTVFIEDDDAITAGGYPVTRSARYAGTMVRFYGEVLEGASATVTVERNGVIAHGPVAISFGAPVSQTINVAVAQGDRLTYNVVADARRLWLQMDGGEA